MLNVKCCGSFIMIRPLERVGNLIKGQVKDIGTTTSIPYEIKTNQIVYYSPIYIDSTLLIKDIFTIKVHFIKYYNIAAMDSESIEEEQSTIYFSGFSGFKESTF